MLQRLFRFLLLVGAALLQLVECSIVSTADSRLPMSLSTVVSDLEAEGCTELSTACLITSLSVSNEKRVELLEQLLDSGDIRHNEEAGQADTWKAVAVANGFAVAQPATVQETASAACACGGTILYYPDATDLQRGEGLFDRLAPAMEKILSQQQQQQQDKVKSSLYVMIDEQDNEAVKERLEQAATSVLSNLIGDVTSLQDVFANVVYVTPGAAMNAVLSDSADNKTTPSDVLALVAELWAASEFSWSTTESPDLSPANLAAARKLGPAARVKFAEILRQVESACDGLVNDFGALCDAALKQATLEDERAARSAVGKQIGKNLKADLDAALSDLFQEQLELLQLSQFEEFKRSLSKLLVSPNLENDMMETAKKSVAAYGAAAKKLVPKKASSAAAWNIQPSKHEFSRKCHDYVANRILNAKAAGKFKPLPRKGVTVGLHWLLPKPFGNDFRQEPWMEHATDGMVYIPKDGGKVSDVNPDEVAAGDWRDKIVPSPAGNDMLYMQ